MERNESFKKRDVFKRVDSEMYAMDIPLSEILARESENSAPVEVDMGKHILECYARIDYLESQLELANRLEKSQKMIGVLEERLSKLKGGD